MKSMGWRPATFEVKGQLIFRSVDSSIRTTIDLVNKFSWEMGANAVIDVEFEDIPGQFPLKITGTAIYYNKEWTTVQLLQSVYDLILKYFAYIRYLK